MNYTIKSLYSMIAGFIKLFFIVAIMMLVLQYVMLNILVYRVVEQSEKDGYISKVLYDKLVDEVITFDKSKLEVAEVKPDWDVKVNKLGDELNLKLKYEYTFNFFNKDITFPMAIEKQGINQGYYGSGY